MALRLPRDLHETTVLSLGDFGRYEGEVFELQGRRCVQGSRGQIWNEWNVVSKHEPPIVLSESWGTFTMFRPGSLLPTLEELHVGAELGPPWMVVERGRATRLAAYGGVEDAEEHYDYADLSFLGTQPRRASIAEEQTFLGEPVDLTALGLAPRDDVPALVPAPNVSMPSGIELWLDVGDKGTLDGVDYHVLGIVARHATPADEELTRWEDYLLYNARIGLRWLSVADGHWSYASPVEPGVVAGPRAHVIAPATNLLAEAMSGTPTRVDWAAGQLPWSAEIGETAQMKDYFDIVLEWTGSELSASRLRDVSSDDVARAFGKRSLPRPR